MSDFKSRIVGRNVLKSDAASRQTIRWTSDIQNVLRVPSSAGKSTTALRYVLCLLNLGEKRGRHGADLIITFRADLSNGPGSVVSRMNVKPRSRGSTSQVSKLRYENLLLGSTHVLISKEDHIALGDCDHE